MHWCATGLATGLLLAVNLVHLFRRDVVARRRLKERRVGLFKGEVDQFAGPLAGARIFGILAQFETEAGSDPILLICHDGLIVAHLAYGNGARDPPSVRLYALNGDTP